MEVKLTTPRPSDSDVEEGRRGGPSPSSKHFDYSQRAQWLRAVVLGGNEGLVSTALLMMVMGTFTYQTKPLLVTGLVSLVAGALNLATGEFVSVYTQVDIVRSQNKRDHRRGRAGQAAPPPSPMQIAVVASATYLVCGVVPLMAAVAARDEKVRFWIAAVTASLEMVVLGSVGAALGKAPVARSCARVVMGGWIEIAILLGKRKVLELYGL